MRRNPILNRSILRDLGHPTWGEGGYSSPAPGRDVAITDSDDRRSTPAITRPRSDELMDKPDPPMGEDSSLRDLGGISPFPEIPSTFGRGAEFPSIEPLPVDDPVETPRAQGRKREFGSLGSSSQEEYDDYWATRVPMQVGMRSSRFFITGLGRSPLCPLIDPYAVGSSHDGGDRESNPIAPKQSVGSKRRIIACGRDTWGNQIG